MQKNWFIKNPDSSHVNNLVKNLNISPVIATLLINRNLTAPKDANYFLNASLSSLHDPFLMKDMKSAVERVKQAIHKKENILIYGDYDVDGITAVALLVFALRQLGAKSIHHYIPNRAEGYGLNENIIKFAQQKDISLIITVDCGMSSGKIIKSLKQIGIQTIICDHHQPDTAAFPHDALCILNPLQKGCSYPYKDLSGVGIAFKLACALFPPDCRHKILEHLDLVSLGTVCDVVPLTGENRILVKEGLECLTQTKKKGLRALIEVSSLKGKDISAHFVGYILGPRINVSGRLGSPEVSLKLLLTDDDEEAARLARILDSDNRYRQRLEEDILQDAVSKVEREVNFKFHKVIVLSDENWHQGIIGVVASKMVERFYRPTIMIALKSYLGKGSGRSIKNFHLFEALLKCRDLLEGFGGHQYAAGLVIHKKNLSGFTELINTIARDTLSPQDLVPTVEIDLELELDKLTAKLFEQMERLAPFGLGNPRPTFLTRSLKLKGTPKTFGRNNLKFWVTDKRITCQAIGFRITDSYPECLNGKVDLVYTPSFVNWQGIPSIQLQLKDMKNSQD